jgi:protein-tyrosine phosphatase
VTRNLHWDGCVNARDLGGLPTGDGGETRRGVVARSDSTRRLSDAGWQALVDHGVRTVVDLRWHEELAADPAHELPIELVHISLFGERDDVYWAELEQRLARWSDRVDISREANLDLLERFHGQFVAAVTAVAQAGSGVVIHCAAGKDRTGLLAALLLRLAGVGIGDVADDYAESNGNLDALTEAWRAEAPDEEERARRLELHGTPRESMVAVLHELERRYGGVREYLLAGGASPDDLDRIVTRLR